MLCACSGEQFKFEEPPQSPESLATRDFSASGLSSRTGDWEAKFDDAQVDEAESTLKEALSLNYEVRMCFFLCRFVCPKWRQGYGFELFGMNYRKLGLCWGGLNTREGTLMLPFKYFRGLILGD